MNQQPLLVPGTIASGASMPALGEGLRLRLPKPLRGLGSLLDATAPTGATRFNYHTAFVISASYKSGIVLLEVLPAPSFSYPDEFGDSSATWLLKQDSCFRERHLPLPFDRRNQPDPAQPETPTPQAFGIPLYLSFWLDRRPSWLDIDIMTIELTTTAQVNCYFLRGFRFAANSSYSLNASARLSFSRVTN